VPASMTDAELASVSEYLSERRAHMVDFVMELANLETPSLVAESQHAIQGLLTRRLEAIGFNAQLFPGRTMGDHLYLSRRKAPGTPEEAPVQLLVGHTDTVWPLGTVYEMPVEWDKGEDTIRGPGVFDMKAGIAQMVFALEALSALGLEPTVTPTIFLNSDEEVGSPESSGHVARLAQASSRVLVLEPALGPEGHIKTTRRGVARFEIRIVGRASHSGLALEEGASAIQEMAHVILALHALTDVERGIGVNVGTVSGGSATNVVAAECHASVDVRVTSQADARLVEGVIRSLKSTTPGTRMEIEQVVDVPPMEATPRNQVLWEAVKGCGKRLGLELESVRSGGASDGNTTSLYAATVDGLGALGHGAHAHDEHVLVSGLLERTMLLVLILMMPPLEF
jgi:glutamate carboxypeptidase